MIICISAVLENVLCRTCVVKYSTVHFYHETWRNTWTPLEVLIAVFSRELEIKVGWMQRRKYIHRTSYIAMWRLTRRAIIRCKKPDKNTIKRSIERQFAELSYRQTSPVIQRSIGTFTFFHSIRPGRRLVDRYPSKIEKEKRKKSTSLGARK